MRKSMFIFAALVFLVAACLPVQDTQDLESRVNTAVAQTMAAEDQIANSVEQTVAAQVPASPTLVVDVPSAAVTETPLAFPTFTFTPIVIDTVTPLPVNPTATRRPVQQAQYSCNAILRKPADNTQFNPGAHFDIKWTIVNTGTKSWVAGIDVKYYSGPKMATTTRYEIPKVMNPGDTYEIDLDGVAPNKKGRQVMTWAVDGPMCFPYVAITVK
ncbi:MAG: hypothetical protein IH588_16705 [Anaerolineales bacterium]|nr:hypothetical protein [Anaerolineales bacterium]